MSWFTPKVGRAPAVVDEQHEHFVCDACHQLMPRDLLTTELIRLPLPASFAGSKEEWWPWLRKDVTACRQRAQAAGVYLRSAS